MHAGCFPVKFSLQLCAGVEDFPFLLGSVQGHTWPLTIPLPSFFPQ